MKDGKIGKQSTKGWKAMNEESEARPLADEGREQFARGLASSGKSPEEYAARYGRGIGCSSLDQYRYRDARVQAWIYRLMAILTSPRLFAECEERYLRPEELEEARRGAYDAL